MRWRILSTITSLRASRAMRNSAWDSNAHSIGGHHSLTAKSVAERKRDERERMRDAGFVLRQFWVHPQDWPRVQKYLTRLLEKRR